MPEWDGSERREFKSIHCDAHSAHVVCMQTIAEEIKAIRQGNFVGLGVFKWTVTVIIMLIIGVTTIPLILTQNREQSISEVKVQQATLVEKLTSTNDKLDLLMPAQNERIHRLEDQLDKSLLFPQR